MWLAGLLFPSPSSEATKKKKNDRKKNDNFLVPYIGQSLS